MSAVPGPLIHDPGDEPDPGTGAEWWMARAEEMTAAEGWMLRAAEMAAAEGWMLRAEEMAVRDPVPEHVQAAARAVFAARPADPRPSARPALPD